MKRTFLDPLQEIIDRFGITQTDKFMPKPEVKERKTIELGGAEEVPEDFIWDAKNRGPEGIFIHPRTGEREPVYIHTSMMAHSRDREELPKWHLTLCSTLSASLNKQRLDRYAIKDSPGELFPVTSYDNREYQRKLRVCKHCLGSLAHLFDRHVDAETYTYAEFKKQFGKTESPDFTEDLFGYKDTPKDPYPKNWDKIRAECLRRDNYRCQEIKGSGDICGKRENLSVHHIDERKQNNAMENLITLCRDCHQKKHSHHFNFGHR